MITINETGNQVIATISQHDAFHLLGALGLAVGILFGAVMVIFNLFYVLSIRKTMKLIPIQHHSFPPGLLWLIIVPGIGYIFEWIMLPFGVPSAIKSFFGVSEISVEQPQARFFGLGLAIVLVSLFGVVIPFGLTAVLILKIIYWAQIVSLRYKMRAHASEK